MHILMAITFNVYREKSKRFTILMKTARQNYERQVFRAAFRFGRLCILRSGVRC